MPVDEKILQEKIDAGTALTKEEENFLLQEEGPVEGYTKNDFEDMTQEEFDKPEEKKVDETNTAEDETKGAKDETKPPQETQKKEETQDKQADKKEDVFVKLERELAKPEGQEDLKAFTDREKAYFHQMRRDRKRAQKAEADLDVERRKTLQLEKDKSKSEEKVEEVDPLDELKKKDPTDYLTVAEVTQLIEKLQAPAKKDIQENKPQVDQRQMKYLKMCEKEARETHPEDFDSVMELTEEIINNNPQHLIEVAKAMQAGENPAIKAYELIKADPEFATLFQVAKTKIEAKTEKTKHPEKKDEKSQKNAEETDKEKKVKKAEEALEKPKPKTTGHVDASGGETGGEMSLDEIAKMSDREFARLPRKTRQKYLEMMRDL